MSDDEYQLDDQGEINYDVAMSAIPVDWRSDELNTFLHALDTWGRKVRAAKSLRGSAPALRVYVIQPYTRAQTRPPVTGLPRNAYRPSWLAALSPEDVLALDVKEELFDFDSALDFAS